MNPTHSSFVVTESGWYDAVAVQTFQGITRNPRNQPQRVPFWSLRLFAEKEAVRRTLIIPSGTSLLVGAWVRFHLSKRPLQSYLNFGCG